MPELPEVETIVRDARKTLIGKRVARVDIFDPLIVRTPIPAFRKGLTGAVIQDVSRRAKFIVLGLDRPLTVLVHLKMTGQLLYREAKKRETHTRLILSFEGGGFLHYADIRRFGAWRLYPKEKVAASREIRDMGTEPLHHSFSWDRFNELMDAKRGKVKAVLLDQTFVCGIGNIYSDEILFQARVHPTRKAESLKPRERKDIYHAIRENLEEGIRQRGCSIENYVDLFGEQGKMHLSLKVYGKKGKACPCCGLPIQTAKVGGRTAHFCGHCQK